MKQADKVITELKANPGAWMARGILGRWRMVDDGGLWATSHWFVGTATIKRMLMDGKLRMVNGQAARLVEAVR